jgi:hypothetical protein
VSKDSIAETPDNEEEEAKIVHVYTRAQAIEDGFLVDVSELLPESKLPVAVTAAAWALISNIPPSKWWQDVKGRLWDAYYMGMMAARRAPEASEVVVYQLIMHNGRKAYATLKLHIGPGDDGEAVLTIMLPEED